TVTLTVTSTGNGTCVPVSDQVTITITPAPIVNAGADQTICADLPGTPLDATFTIASGGVWTSAGSGTFSPNNTVPNPSYIPSDADTASGTVALTFTTTVNGTCNAVSCQLLITINPAAVVHAGPDQTACADIAEVVLAGGIANAGGGVCTTTVTGAFLPDNISLNASYVPSDA